MQSPPPHLDLPEVTQERQHTVKQTMPQWKGWKIADPSPDPVHRIEKTVSQRQAPPPASMRVPLPVAYQNVDHGHEVFEHRRKRHLIDNSSSCNCCNILQHTATRCNTRSCNCCIKSKSNLCIFSSSTYTHSNFQRYSELQPTVVSKSVQKFQTEKG